MRLLNLTLITTLLFISFNGFAQSKSNWSIFFERSYNFTGFEKPTIPALFSGYENTPQELYNMGEVPERPTASAPGSNTDETPGENNFWDTESVQSFELMRADFRISTIGVSKVLKEELLYSFSQSFALGNSKADFYLGFLHQSESRAYLTVQPNEWGYSPQQYYLNQESLEVYKKIRMATFSYENVFTAKPFKRLNISIGARHQLNLRYVDEIIYDYQKVEDSLVTDWSYIDCVMNCGLSLSLPEIADIDQPRGVNYQTLSKSPMLYYDLYLYLQPSLVLGRNNGMKLYVNIGSSPISFYGKEYKSFMSKRLGFGTSINI